MQLKDFFDQALVEAIAQSFVSAYPPFDQAGFVAQSVNGLNQLELIQRGAHIATAMRAHLPTDYRSAIDILLNALIFSAPTPSSMSSFRYLPHTIFVATYGLDDFTSSMRAQKVLTQHFTAEFSIRPFLIKYPEETLALLSEWVKEPNDHVRRLVTEGTRPRLPWGTRLTAFIADPAPVLALLEGLRDDPAVYVQRSVANNLNDIAKDHPELIVTLCRRWMIDAPPSRQWIVRHALRVLVKRGNHGALKVLGVGSQPKINITDIDIPRRVRIGDKAQIFFTLTSCSSKVQTLEVDFAVHFVKANGTTAAKIFKLRKLTLSGRESVRLSRTISFAPMTTRTPYPGCHVLETQINGVKFPLGRLKLFE